MSVGTSAVSTSSATIEVSGWQRFLWSVRRELWEYRSIYLAPLAAGGVAIIGFLAAEAHDWLGHGALPHEHDAIAGPYEAGAALILAASLFVAVFYCLEALHAERRDRSILFWKSIPVSDVTTVLAKAMIPLLVLPVVGSAVAFVAQFIMLLLNTALAAGSGQDVAMLSREVAPLRSSLELLYHMLTIHVLWWAPFYGWLMLVSAWARRAPLLWATLPPLGVAGLEKIIFNSRHFLNLLQYRFEGPATPDLPVAHSIAPMVEPVGFLMTPGLWAGLALTAIFLATAIRVRRYREPV